MWGTLIQVGIWAGLYVANYLLRPKPKKPKPLDYEALSLPRTEEGTPIPIVFGRCRVTAPTLAWTGPLRNKTNSVGGGYAITYGVDMLFVVGIPMTGASSRFNILNDKTPRLYAVWYGDKKLPLKNGLPNSGGNGANIVRAQAVHRPNFLGGLGAGGGLFGAYEWWWGAPDQDLTQGVLGTSSIGDKLTDWLGGDPTLVPGFRNQMLVSFTDDFGTSYGVGREAADGADATGTHPSAWSVGESPSINGFSFEVGSYGNKDATVTTMVQPGYDFGGDADPVEVLYDTLTSGWGKIGLADTAVDKASFLAASAVLKAEGHGYSCAHYDAEDGTKILSDVLHQIDSALYEEPTTGKLTLKLIRADYDPALLPVFDKDNIVDVEDYGIGGWKESINEVRVNYTDRSSEYKTGTAVAQSLANATVNSNRRRIHSVDHPGISNAVIAAKVAARTMNVVSRPLKKISLVLNRDAYALRPGSCFKVTYAEYNLSSVIFRCQRVDVGQLFDNKVVVDAVEDAFASTYVGMPLGWGVIPFPTPYPLVDQTVTEVPYWLALLAKNIGVVNDQNVPRLFGVARPTLNAVKFALASREEPIATGSGIGYVNTSPGADPLLGEYLPDVPATDMPATFTVLADYFREDEPYDTAVGLEVGNFEDPNRPFSELEDALTLANPGSIAIRSQGANLILVVTPDGDMEFMSFESVSTLPGDTLLFNSVWRGVMDTPAIDIPAGSRGYFVSGLLVGRRGYAEGKVADYELSPHGSFVAGSGDDERGSLTVRGRPWLPAPVHDMRLTGERMSGLTGQPPVAGQFKSVSRMEECFDVYGRTRLRQSSLIERGDFADQANTDFSATTYYPFAYKVVGNGDTDLQGFGIASTATGDVDDVSGALAGCVLLDGYGTLHVQERSKRVIAAGDPTIGLAGLELGDVLTSWDHPEVSVVAPEWRNVMANPRFTYSGNPWWTISNMVVNTSGQSVTLNTGHKYARGNAAAAVSVSMVVPVSNWRPRGMTAIAWGYFRNLLSDTNDTASLTCEALDAASGSLGTNVAAAAMVNVNWQWTESPFLLPANTAKVKWTATFVEVAGGGGTGSADGAVSESGICVGQIANGTLTNLLNHSFETAAMASWTVSAGNFTQTNLIRSPSPQYAKGGASATNTAFQEFTLPAGYECGATAVLRGWRAQDTAGDAGTVKVEAMNAASTVLATATTGSEQMSTLNEWFFRVLACDVPDGSTKVRVTITALKSTGADSGALFDELKLGFHKKLDPTFEQRMIFSERLQPQPSTWQEYARDFDANYKALGYGEAFKPSAVFSPQSQFGFSQSQQQASGQMMEWSDDTPRATGRMVGKFDGRFVDAFRFTRMSGGSAVCLEARDQAIDKIGSFTAAQTFGVVVFFRVDELPWSGVGFGLVGRADLTAGWSLEVTAAGEIQVVVEGTGGTKTATVAGSVVDGAVHMAAFSYDAVNQRLIAYSERGPGVTVSTASGLGEFARTGFETCRLRIGRGSNSVDTIPGMISRVYMFDVRIGEDEVAAHWSYAEDPTDLGPAQLTYSRSVTGWVQNGADANDDQTVAAFATDQWAICNETSFMGLALGRASNTNRVPSWNFAGASWVKDAGATLVQAVEDLTGKLAGVTVTATTTDGFKVIGLTSTATTTFKLVFWAKSTVSSGVTLSLLNASDVVKNTQTITVGTTWTRFVVAFTGWDNSSGTLRIKWTATAGTKTFTLGSVIWGQEGDQVPVIYPEPTVTMGDVRATWVPSAFLRQLNSEGELEIIGKALATPLATGSLCNLKNVTNSNNRREVTASATGQAILNHYNGTAVNVTSTGTAFDWKLNSSVDATINAWRVRARWCRASTLDNAANPFAGVVSDCNVQSAVYGRAATFTESSDVDTTLEINNGSLSGLHWILGELAIRTRESKLV